MISKNFLTEGQNNYSNKIPQSVCFSAHYWYEALDKIFFLFKKRQKEIDGGNYLKEGHYILTSLPYYLVLEDIFETFAQFMKLSQVLLLGRRL